MNALSIKFRVARRYWATSLIFFLLSFGLYEVVRESAGGFVAILIASVFFSAYVFIFSYIAAAVELWPLKKLTDGGMKDAAGWADPIKDMDVPPEIRDVEAVMRGLKNRMDEVVSSQKRFLADASHEMRSPITIMRGNIEIALRRERDTDEYKRVLESNLEEISRLEYLLNDLMFLARSDTSELAMNIAPMRIDELMALVAEGVSPLAAKKDITLELSFKDDHGYVIDGDRERIRQLFINLVENAIRYTPKGGRVILGLDTLAEVVRATVTDTGMGIPEGEITRIFDRFYRVDKARSRESGGTGLGLCICKWIVDAHRGDISIESVEGKGTKVTVMFLASEAPTSP